MIILHEIPQELGDFGVLLYGGLSKFRALFYNFLSALTAILGTIVGFFVSESVYNIIVYLLPIAAGGFIYIAASDLVPEIQKQKEIKLANVSLFCFVFGVILMYILKINH
jgi:zinc and cadmium transporter